MGFERRPNPSRLHRLVEELGEIGLILDGSEGWHELAIAEIDYAMRPDVHERRVPSAGAFIAPMTDPPPGRRRRHSQSTGGQRPNRGSIRHGTTPTVSRAG